MKRAEKKKRAYQRHCKAQARKGLINTADGTWLQANGSAWLAQRGVVSTASAQQHMAGHKVRV